ncbi:facilitated trehalose transporter Tret1-2 homolog isoform X2 [Danaus plexippus]|uniref:facilitated trehalose transporter Tret1-2 homolog isoform X2 n=1 Tax=Danaus plexippus TaxID=13037 RepID=UPI002AAF9C6E|nr:facilitated trehalose transporter Tret1-2 homolog isoform X2 [Danaus plexippus]
MSEKVKPKAFLMQGCATLIICFLTSLTGFVFAWPSYTFQIYLSNETYLEAPISTSQMSMLGSIINVGALLGTPLTVYMADKLGRKYSAMLVGLPYVITWALISVTRSYYVVLFSLGLSGLSAAGQSISSIYISEICQDSIRGSLTSSVNYGYLIGLLISYTMGGYMSYYSILYAHLALSILYIIMLIPLKESPCYLLKIGKEKEARDSIAFYRRVDVDSKEVEGEIKSLRVQLDLNSDIIIEDSTTNHVPETVNEHQETFIKFEPRPVKKKISSWQFLNSIFKEAIPSMRPNTCAILLVVDYLMASLVGASTLDKLGRKNLMTITSFIAGIFTILIGTQLHMHWAPYWFTAVIIYLHSFIFNLGVAQVPLVLAAEVFLPEVRALGNSIALAFLWITNWIVVSTFFPLVEFIGLGQTFYIFSVICFIGSVYSHLCLPETKGLSADAIQLLFIKKERNSNLKV